VAQLRISVTSGWPAFRTRTYLTGLVDEAIADLKLHR
jgi:hypothetical protein